MGLTYPGQVMSPPWGVDETKNIKGAKMALTNRYDFLFLFDVANGNPNGDPNFGNQPRQDTNGYGIVTDGCIKRKLRNYIVLQKDYAPGFNIFIKDGAVLNDAIGGAFEQPDIKKLDKKDTLRAAQNYLCKEFFDIRAFGAVLTTGEKDKQAGWLCGPVQITFSESFDTIQPTEHCITRCAVTNIKDVEKERTMGTKWTVDYALYMGQRFINPKLADKTGFDEEDLQLTLQGLMNMFEADRSAARGLMTTRKVIVFRHDSQLGNASATELFERLSVTHCEGVEEVLSFKDYKISFDDSDLPEGITVFEVGRQGNLIPLSSV